MKIRYLHTMVRVTDPEPSLRFYCDLLGLRDCAPSMPIVFAGQTDLFAPALRAACMRHEFGFCTGPCAGFVTEQEYHRRAETGMAFLEGRTIQPIDRIVDEAAFDLEHMAQRRSEAARIALDGDGAAMAGVRWDARFDHEAHMAGETVRRIWPPRRPARPMRNQSSLS